MPYGIIKVDTVTFTDNGVDKNISLSGLVQNPTFTGNVTATGTISGDIIRGGTTVSGLTVTGTTANFASGVFTTQVSGTTITGATITATTGNFTSLTGTTTTGTTANFVSGVFSTQVSGATIIAPTGTFTSLTGTTTTGTTANFVSGVFSTQVSGVTITGTTVATTTGTFVSLTGTTATFTSGIIASGTAALPSLAILSDPNTGIFSPGADQVAISTNGTGRLFVDATGNVGIGNNGPNAKLAFGESGTIAFNTTLGTTGTYAEIKAFNTLVPGTTAINIRFIRDVASVGNDGAICFDTTGAERMRITSAGLVGIGTSSPQQLLQVGGFSGSNGITVGAGSSNYSFIYLADGTSGTEAYRGYLQYNHATDKLELGSAGLTAITVDSSQRVGIGNSGPVGKLSVETASATDPGTVSSAGWDSTYVLIGDSDNANGANLGLGFRPGDITSGFGTQIVSLDPNSDWYPINYHGNLHVWYGGGTERARIDTSGRLLVGTSTARSNLFGGVAPQVQIEGNSFAQTTFSIVRNENLSSSVPGIVLGKTRGASNGANTVVQSGDNLGLIDFQGADGTNLVSAARISADVDGTPGSDDMPGRLVFSTTSDSASSPTERMRITSTGQVRLAGAGITFNGDTAAANELDDYEEGTWTPSVGGTATYSNQNGTYTKIGRTVTINFSLTITLLGTGSNFQISGLPFNAGMAGYGATGYFSGLAINVIGLTCNVTGTTVLFNSINASGSTATNNPAILGDSCIIQGNVTYFV